MRKVDNRGVYILPFFDIPFHSRNLFIHLKKHTHTQRALFNTRQKGQGPAGEYEDRIFFFSMHTRQITSFTLVFLITSVLIKERRAYGSLYHLIIKLFHLIWQTKKRVNILFFCLFFFLYAPNIENYCLFSYFQPKTENMINI